MRYLSVLQLLALSAPCEAAFFRSAVRVSTKVDHYEVLGLKRTATRRDIRNSYKKLAKEFHPDKDHSPEAQKKFRAISEAHEVLSDKKAKKDYDSSLQESQRTLDFDDEDLKSLEKDADFAAFLALLREAQKERDREQSALGAGNRQRSYTILPGFGIEDAMFEEIFDNLTPLFTPILWFYGGMMLALFLVCCIWMCCCCYRAIRFRRQRRRPVDGVELEHQD